MCCGVWMFLYVFPDWVFKFFIDSVYLPVFEDVGQVTLLQCVWAKKRAAATLWNNEENTSSHFYFMISSDSNITVGYTVYYMTFSLH